MSISKAIYFNFHFVLLVFYRLSIFLEAIDPARKKQPVNNLDALTLSYKVDEPTIQKVDWCFFFVLYDSLWNASPVIMCLSVCCPSGSLACWHCDQLRVSEDLQSSVSSPAADQMGQIQSGHTTIQWCVCAELRSPSQYVTVIVSRIPWKHMLKCIFLHRFDSSCQKGDRRCSWGGDSQRTRKPTNPPNVPATSQTDAFCE